MKPANWHQYDSEMTISKLVVQEALHESDGAFPIELQCNWLGGTILLEIMRNGDVVMAVYYLSEISAALWSANLGFQFIDSGWKVIEGISGKWPFTIGFFAQKAQPEELGEAVEASFDLLMPEVVKTGNYAIPDYSCPNDYLPAS